MVFGRKKKVDDTVYDNELKKTLESLKGIAEVLEATAEDFREQIQALKEINQTKVGQ